MIRRLRRRHRVVWILLALAIPALVTWAILNRNADPLLHDLPETLVETGAGS